MVMLCFTPAFNIEPKYRKIVGYLLPYLVLLASCVNLLLQIHAIWWQFKFNRRRKQNFIASKNPPKIEVIDLTKSKPLVF
jgi:hypothetical protein